MEMDTLDFVEEMTIDDFRGIVRYSLGVCSLGLFIERHGLPASERELAFRERVKPHIVDVREQAEWPGTRLFDSTATVVYFALNSEVSEILSSVDESTFDWRWPNMPEDLCLLRKDESVWFGSISHERDAWLSTTPSEKTDLLASSQPWLRLLRER